MKICLYNCVDWNNGEIVDVTKGILDSVEVESFNVFKGEFPSSLQGYEAFIVNGSMSDVHDRDRWIRNLESLIETKKPMLGICFGHQLIAKVLGGSVELLEKRNFGYQEVSLTKEAREHPLFHGIPRKFKPFFTHRWIVTSLPEGGRKLAENHVGIQSFEKGNFLGVQFHLDITPDIAKKLAEKYGIQESFDPEDEARAAEINSRILNNFVSLCSHEKT